MTDVAPMQNFVAAMMRKAGFKQTGRPRKSMTIADLAPLPKGMQTRNPTRDKLPPLPGLPPAR